MIISTVSKQNIISKPTIYVIVAVCTGDMIIVGASLEICQFILPASKKLSGPATPNCRLFVIEIDAELAQNQLCTRSRMQDQPTPGITRSGGYGSFY